MNPKQPENGKPDFGEPLDLDTMLNFAKINMVDIEGAILWWDEHASENFVGALEAEPIDKSTR
jgi:hypothetical protein